MPQRTGSCAGQAAYGVIKRHEFPLPVGATFDLDLALGKPPRPHQDLPGNTDQVSGREFRPGPLVQVMGEGVDPSGRQGCIEALTGWVRIGSPLLEVEYHDLERRDRLRPFDAGFIVEGLDDGAHEPAWADAVRAHVYRVLCPVRASHHGLHGRRVLGAEIEDVTDLDAPRR